jgi:broad specificity phosphatase PhoE
MKRVYFVRHGETTYNRDRLVQDGTPLLTDAGLKQAYRVAERLANIDFEHLLVSDYERTKQTALPVSELTGKVAEYSPLFREVRRPSVFFHQSNQTEEYLQYLQDEQDNFVNPSWRHSDEENFADTFTRAQAALADVSSRSGDVVVVSHGHFIRLLTAMVITGGQLTGEMWQLFYTRIKVSNTGITTALFENDDWKLLTFNDHAHFAE